MTNRKCKICNGPIDIGIALSDKQGHFWTEIGIAPINNTLTVETMRLSEVYKCLECGHSEPLMDRGILL